MQLQELADPSQRIEAEIKVLIEAEVKIRILERIKPKTMRISRNNSKSNMKFIKALN